MARLEFVRVYIDDMLCITNRNVDVAGTNFNVWNRHLAQLEQVLERLKEAGLKVNAKKSFFGKQELEYLGYL